MTENRNFDDMELANQMRQAQFLWVWSIDPAKAEVLADACIFLTST
jgi:hypothetical protein